MDKSGEVVDIQNVVNSIEDIDPAEAAACREFSAFPASDMPVAYRARYSSRPAFMAGAELPVRSAEDTLFTREPAITEALEAIYIQGHNHDAESVGLALEPVNHELAIGGLKKIKESADISVGFRTCAADALKHARCVVESGNDSMAAMSSSPDTATAPSTTKAEAKTSQREAQTAHDEHRAEQTRRLTEEIHSRESGLNIDDYMSLLNLLGGRVQADGTIAVKPRKGFHKLLDDFKEPLMMEPDRLGHFMIACRVLPNIEGSGLDDTLSPYHAAIKDAAEQGRDELEFDVCSAPPQVLARWFQKMDDLPLGLTLRDLESPYYKKPLSDDQLISAGITLDYFGPAVLKNLMSTLDRVDPSGLIDRIHRLVEYGFDPTGIFHEEPGTEKQMEQDGKSYANSMTTAIIRSFFGLKPMADVVFKDCPGSRLRLESRVKALDLHKFLGYMGHADLTSSSSPDEPSTIITSRNQERLISRIYPFKQSIRRADKRQNVAAYVDTQAMRDAYQETTKALADRLASPATSTATLLGRFLKARPEEILPDHNRAA